MTGLIYGDNEEEFRYSEVGEALEMAWDASPIDTTTYIVWEGELIDGVDRLVIIRRERRFKQVRNQQSEYFDFDNFLEVGHE